MALMNNSTKGKEMKRLAAAFLITCLMASPALGQRYDRDPISVSGAVVDSRTYDGLAAAMTAIGAVNPTTLVIAQDEEPASSMTVSDNIGLLFRGDGKISALLGVTVTIDTTRISKDISHTDAILEGAGDFDFADGTQVDSDWFATIDEVFRHTVNDTVVVDVTRARTLSTNQTVGTGVRLEFSRPGCRISINNAIQLSGVGQVEAGSYLCFTGLGRPDFDDGVTVNSSWFDDFRTAVSYVDNSEVELEVRELSTLYSAVTIHANTRISVPTKSHVFTFAGGSLDMSSCRNSKIFPEWFSGSSIDDAVDSGVGKVVYLSGGVTYSEDNITIAGNGTVIDGFGTIESVTTNSNNILEITGNDVRILNITLDGNSANKTVNTSYLKNSLIHCTGTGLRVIGAKLYDPLNHGIVTENSWVKIYDNSFEEINNSIAAQSTAVFLRQIDDSNAAEDMIVATNSFDDCYRYVKWWGGDPVTDLDVRISRVVVLGNIGSNVVQGGAGYFGTNAQGVVLSSNIGYNLDDVVFDFEKTDYSTVVGNIGIDAENAAFALYHGASHTVWAGNVGWVWDAGACGFEENDSTVGGYSANVLAGNLFKSDGAAGGAGATGDAVMLRSYGERSTIVGNFMHSKKNFGIRSTSHDHDLIVANTVRIGEASVVNSNNGLSLYGSQYSLAGLNKIEHIGTAGAAMSSSGLHVQIDGSAVLSSRNHIIGNYVYNFGGYGMADNNWSAGTPDPRNVYLANRAARLEIEGADATVTNNVRYAHNFDWDTMTSTDSGYVPDYEYIDATFTLNPANVIDGASVISVITITGAAVGDAVEIYPPYTLAGLSHSAYVQAADTVELILDNQSGAPQNLASNANWRVRVTKLRK